MSFDVNNTYNFNIGVGGPSGAQQSQGACQAQSAMSAIDPLGLLPVVGQILKAVASISG